MDLLVGRLGALYAVLACVTVALPAPRRRAEAGAGLALVGLAAAADRVGHAVNAGSFPLFNALLGALGVVLLLGAALRPRGASRAPPSSAAAFDPGGTILLGPGSLGLLLGGTGLAAFAPDLVLLGLGSLLALASVVPVLVRTRRFPFLILLVGAAAGLAAVVALLLTILGPEGAGVAQLGEGPFSLAAERWAALGIGTVGLVIAGLPPLQDSPWRGRLALLAGILLTRLVARPFVDGLLAWQAPAMAILTAGLAWSAWRRRWPQVAVAGGLLAIWSGVPDGALSGGVLIGWGWLVELVAAAAARRGLRLERRWAGLPALPVVLAALPALEAGLRAQVVLSVLAVMACAAGLLRTGLSSDSPRAAPLY